MKNIVVFWSLLIAANVWGEKYPHVDVSLVADRDVVGADGKFRVGWLFTPDPGWHIYWQNPGDTGLAPEFSWRGAKVSSVYWPFPEAIPVAHLMNYGYHKPTLIMADAVAENLDSDSISISSDISWLVCKETCIPGEAQQTIEIKHNQTAISSDHQNVFNATQESLPLIVDTLGGAGKINAGYVEASIYAKSKIFGDATDIEIFVKEKDIVAYNSPANIRWKKNMVNWRAPLNEYYSSKPEQLHLVVVKNKNTAYEFTIDIQ